MSTDNTATLNAAIDAEAAKMGLTPEEVDGGVDLTEIKAGEALNPGFSVADTPGEDNPEDPKPEDKKPEEGKVDEKSKEKTEDEPSDPKDKAREEFKKRETKQMLEDFKSEIFAGLDEKLKGLKDATPAEKKEIKAEVSEDIKAFAAKYADADGKPLNAEFLEEFAATILAKASKNLPADKLEELDKLAAKDKAQEVTNQFNTEWDKVLPAIKAKYPNASDEQLSKAKEQMKEVLSKAEIKDMEYLFVHKEAKKFDTVLFSPKRKTAEGGRVGEAEMPEEGATPFSYETLTPEKATKAQQEIDDFYSKKKK